MNKHNIQLISKITRNENNSINNILNDKTKLRDFRVFLRNNKLSGFFYSHCKNSDLIKKLPLRFREEIIRHYESQTKNNTYLLDEIIRLDALFREEGLEVIHLKGPVFTKRYYEDIGARSISDIDILVKKYDDIDKADKILRESSYRLKSKPVFGKKITFLFTHHYEYERNGFKLDLHWVLQSHFSYKINYSNVWLSRSYYEIKHKRLRILSNEYELLFRILSIFIDIQLGTISFRSILDLYMLINKLYESIDWNKFIESRERENLANISINIIDLYITVFDMKGRYEILDNIINNNHTKITCKSNDEKIALLLSSPFSYRNKIWAFKSYHTRFLNALIWWIISLPPKISIYRSVFLKPVKKFFK